MNTRYLFPAFILVAAFGVHACRSFSSADANRVTNSSYIQVSPAETNAAEPAVAADYKGNLYVVWVDHSDEKNAGLYLQKFDDNSRPVGERVKVNADGTAVKSWYGDPPTIAIGPDAVVYIGWNRANQDSRGNDLMLSVSRDGGGTFSEAVKVNDDTAPASHGMHSLAVDAKGRVYLSWLDERNIKISEHAGGGHHAEPNSEVFFSVSEDGGSTFAPNKRLASEVCPCCKTALLLSEDGRIYVSWRQVLPGDLRHIAVAHSTDGGSTFSDGVVVSDDKWEINACPVSGAALAADENGNLTVAWYTAGTAGQPGVYTARSADGGRTFSRRSLLSFEAMTGTPVITKTGGDMSFVFPLPEGRVEIWRSDIRNERVTDASYPAAVSSKGRQYVSFVRKSGDQRSSVWLAWMAE